MYCYHQYILLLIVFMLHQSLADEKEVIKPDTSQNAKDELDTSQNVKDETDTSQNAKDETDTLRNAKDKMDDITNFGPEMYCKFQSYTYACGEKRPERSYYYDMRLQECVPTVYGHCKHAYNNFDSRGTCKSTCRDLAHHTHSKNLTENIACRLQPEFGDCHQYHPRFYYDINTETCNGFSYSGCGGNYNRFPNAKVCKAICIPLIKHEEDTM